MAEGDRATLLRLLARHYDELVRHLGRRLGDPAHAQDVAQEAYLRLQDAQPVGELRSPRAYLFRLADNLAIDRLRRERLRGERFLGPLDGETLPSRLPGPEQVAEQRERLRRLQQAVDELPPRCREVFLLHKFDGLSYGEIATRLGISKSGVEKHVMKALGHCRDRLAEPAEPGP